MATPDCNRTTRKPSRLKALLKSSTLKAVLKVARWAYVIYKITSNAIDWILQLMD